MSCSILWRKLIKMIKVNKIILILEINLWFSQIDDEILVQMSSIFFHLTFNLHIMYIRFSFFFWFLKVTRDSWLGLGLDIHDSWLVTRTQPIWIGLGLDLRGSNSDSESRFEDSNTSLPNNNVRKTKYPLKINILYNLRATEVNHLVVYLTSM